MAVHLDDDERAVLLAYREADPKREQWVAPWATGMDIAKHGGSPVAATYNGSVAVARRLCQRKLLEGEPDARGGMRGYSLTDKGEEAIRDV